MLSDAHAIEVIDAVLSVANMADIPAIVGRIETLTKHRTGAIFASLVTTFKRVANIVRQANANTGDVNPSLFEDNAENALHSAILDAKNAYQSAFDAKDYESALTCLEALRAPTDVIFSFFAGILFAFLGNAIVRLIYRHLPRGKYERLESL